MITETLLLVIENNSPVVITIKNVTDYGYTK